MFSLAIDVRASDSVAVGRPEASVGVSVTVQGQTRLAHALGLELFDSLQIGIRRANLTSAAAGFAMALAVVLGDFLTQRLTCAGR